MSAKRLQWKNGDGSGGAAVWGLLLEWVPLWLIGEDRGSGATEAAVEGTPLHDEAKRKLGELRETVNRLDLR